MVGMDAFLLSDADRKKLLFELCIKLGFCTLSDDCQMKLETVPLSLDQFIDTVIEGEGASNTPTMRKMVHRIVAPYYDAATNHGLWWLQFPETLPEPETGGERDEY